MGLPGFMACGRSLLSEPVIPLILTHKLFVSPSRALCISDGHWPKKQHPSPSRLPCLSFLKCRYPSISPMLQSSLLPPQGPVILLDPPQTLPVCIFVAHMKQQQGIGQWTERDLVVSQWHPLYKTLVRGTPPWRSSVQQMDTSMPLRGVLPLTHCLFLVALVVIVWADWAA